MDILVFKGFGGSSIILKTVLTVISYSSSTGSPVVVFLSLM